MIDKTDLEELYMRRHLTMAEIGKIYGLTRQRISQLVKEYGLQVKDAENVACECDTCGKQMNQNRAHWRKYSTHFCSMECYLEDRSNTQYRASKQGQREGRKLMAQHIGRSLTKNEVVHHIDGNCKNNILKNLLLFPSHSAHLRFHHQLRISRRE